MLLRRKLPVVKPASLNGLTSSATSVEEALSSSPPFHHQQKLEAGGFSIWSGLALAACIAVWFINIRAPLWLDETVSYWQIAAGFSHIWQRRGLSVPAYSYILWLTSKLIGSSEIALRVPSILAMFCSAYVLFRIARRMFSHVESLVVVTVFALHPAIVFAAIDVRPYAFAVLAVNCSVLALLQWLEHDSKRNALWFGLSAASVFYFHYILGAMLVPALATVLIWAKRKEPRTLMHLSHYAIVPFLLLLLPVLLQVAEGMRTAQSHVSSPAPHILALVATFAPRYMLVLFAAALLAIAADPKDEPTQQHPPLLSLAMCMVLAWIPLLLLFAISRWTPVHIFLERYRLMAILGIALCWGYLFRRLRPPMIRLAFCAALLLVAWDVGNSSWKEGHGWTWKYAVEAANANAAKDQAPILVCSDLVEARVEPMPKIASESSLFAPLSYYPLSSPVIPLPYRSRPDAETQVREFLAQAIPQRRRFLAIAHHRKTLDWIDALANGSYMPHTLGDYDEIAVVEYLPR